MLFTRRIAVIVSITLFLFQTLAIVAQENGDADKSIVAITEHQLGDQTLSLSAGLMFPLFFQEFGGDSHPTNLTLGGVGELQWNAYVTPHIRLGGELGGAFSRGPNKRTLFMMPLTIKAAYVFDVSRFEFPVFLGVGMNIVRYKDWSHLDFIVKPGVAGYWRYDSNWSFGANAVWWLDFQRVANDQEGEDRMGNFLLFTPSVFYNF